MYCRRFFFAPQHLVRVGGRGRGRVRVRARVRVRVRVRQAVSSSVAATCAADHPTVEEEGDVRVPGVGLDG